MINLTQEEIMKNWPCDNADVPLLSVRCITYNHEPYIAQALDGFLMQKTDFPFEVIVHDDASTDRTADIIREYEKKFPKIVKPIYEVENQYSKGDGSLGKIMNDACKGKYIAFCEGDDYWIDENKLQMQVDFLEKNPDYGLCYTNFNMLYQDTGKIVNNLFECGLKNYIPEYRTIGDWILNKGYVAPMTWVLKRELYDDYDSLHSCDGTFVFFAHAFSKYKVKCFKKITTAVYRVLPESASHSNDLKKVYARNVNIFEVQKKMIKKYNISECILKKVYVDSIDCVLKIAIELNDDRIIEDYLDFLRKNNFDILFELKNLAEIGKATMTSNAYKVGKLVVFPVKMLKKHLLHRK